MVNKILVDFTMDGCGNQAYVGALTNSRGRAIVVMTSSADEEEAEFLPVLDFPGARKISIHLSVSEVFANAPVETVDDISSWQLLVAGVTMLEKGLLDLEGK